MRVTDSAFNSSFINQLNGLTSQQYNLQNQVTTGLRIQAPSDDPGAMEDTLNDQANVAAQTQYGNNITTLQTRATSIYTVLQSLQAASSQAGEYATSAGNGVQDPSALQTDGSEVNGLLNQVVALANTQDPSTGQYLFGGTASSQPPFVATKDANGNITGVTYQGNATVNQTDIGSGVSVTVDIPGANTTGTGARGLFTDSQSGADFINHLISLRDDLNSGNAAAVTTTDSANLQKDEDNITYQVANNGVAQTHLDAASTLVTNNSTSLNTMISNSSSANMVQTMVQLNAAQNAYQAALESGVKVMQLSILNYLS
jgi:flagellar hook-associated protein 3 FlgL